MAGSEKAERKAVEKEEEEKEEKIKHIRSLWWTKRKEQFASQFVSERKEENVKEKGRKRNKSPRAKQFLGRSGRWLFLLLVLMQNWFCIDAAVGRLKPKRKAEVPEIIVVPDAVEGTFVDLDGKSLQEEQKEKHQRKWKRSNGVDRTEMREEENRLRYALLNGSAWSTEKFLRSYKDTFDIFFGMEHRSRKEEMEEQFNKEAKEGWRFAASAARLTEENTPEKWAIVCPKGQSLKCKTARIRGVLGG